MGRAEIVGHHRENRFGELALIRCAGHAHLEDVKGFQARPLGLRLSEVIGVGEGQAYMRGHILQQLHVPVVECALRVGLQ